MAPWSGDVILVDTSVWVDHLRSGNQRLATLLESEQVLCHSFVTGELACGTLRNRGEILQLLERLPEASVAGHREALRLVQAENPYGRGLGWVVVHLLASALLMSCGLWTLDRRLSRAAETLKIDRTVNA